MISIGERTSSFLVLTFQGMQVTLVTSEDLVAISRLHEEKFREELKCNDRNKKMNFSEFSKQINVVE